MNLKDCLAAATPLKGMARIERPGETDHKHLQNWQDNVYSGTMDVKFQKMFNEGDGGELVCKACAIHSSSMLAYNFFHQVSMSNTFTFNKIEYVDVAFEVKLPCLYKQNTKSDFVNANMDIMLVSKGQTDILFVESNFTEHFSNASSQMAKMPEAYYKDDSRFIVKNYFEPIRDAILFFMTKSKSKNVAGYFDGIKQEFCHTIALTNILEDPNIKKSFLKQHNIKKDPCMHFINLVFEPDENGFKKEFKQYATYCDLYDSFIEKIRGSYPDALDLQAKPITYSTLWNDGAFKFSDPRQKSYLMKRYMQFANKCDGNQTSTP